MIMRILSLLFALTLSIHLMGQTASDALRFSRLDHNGGARNIGVMGSLGALGADFGVLSSNPAGLASFRRSELFLSPGLYHTETDARLLGGDNEIATDALNRFHFQNGGLVVAHQPSRGNWKAVNFGIGITQMANYRQKMFYDGLAEGSLTDRFVELADGLSPNQLDQFEGGLAWDAGAIYDSDGDLFYDSDFLLVPGNSKGVTKSQAIDRRGYMNELQLGFAGNYDDKLYVGLTVGVPILNYEESKLYQEQDLKDTIPFFNSLRWEEELQSSGTGINLRLGLIYRVNQMIRIGGAIHTPTSFAITDEYSKTLTYNFTEGNQTQNLVAESPEGMFDYRLYTPWRLIGNTGVIIGKAGFISAEVEWVDYSSASFNFTPDVSNPEFREAERKVNQQIATSFQDALNLRLGGEAAYKIFRFRAGIGFSGTEYANEEMWSRSWSAGLGIREDNFYIDLGFRRQIREEGFIPYETSVAPELNVNTRLVQDLFALTLGIKL
ncbi:MAG: hypothetical protein KA479_05525 [Saprospiraceae bacterium]|nr:hypothetical protein [Saprospiraceae bacterium]